MAKKHYPTGLDNRMRDHDGEIRRSAVTPKSRLCGKPMVPSSPRATVETPCLAMC